MNDGGPAFPLTQMRPEAGQYDPPVKVVFPGMSLRAYAAIRLRVPDSGEDWLDKTIRRARRDEFAGQALAGMTNQTDNTIGDPTAGWDLFSRAAYQAADAMEAESDQRALEEPK